jgi:hypothetical protein
MVFGLCALEISPYDLGFSIYVNRLGEGIEGGFF